MESTTTEKASQSTTAVAEEGARLHHSIRNGKVVADGKFTFDVSTSQLSTSAKFKDDLLLFSFPIEMLSNISEVLKHFNLKPDFDYFMDECKETIAVAENHQNEKGGGKMSFQSFFHNIPESVISVNPRALIVLAINPDGDPANSAKPVGYHVAGYIHANLFDFTPHEDKTKVETGFYYNILRVSDRKIEGKRVYRRMSVFSLMFAIMNDLVEVHGVNFAYACMGKENLSIKRALHRNAASHGRYYERLPFTVFSKINMIYGSKSQSKKLVDITNNEEKLREMYEMVKGRMGSYLFFHYVSWDEFKDLIVKMVEYSKTSGVYMIPNPDGSIAAATIAMNWGEFFEFQIQNPKGIFKLIQKSRVMENFLRFLMGVGEPKDFEKLMKGLSYKYHKEHKVGVTFLPTFKGDPYYKISKSLLSDEYMNFVICRDSDELDKFKKQSAGADGHPRIFLDVPIT
jgi:hypothetical protein